MEEKKEKIDNVDFFYKSIKRVFKGLSLAGIWSREKEKIMVDRLYILYLKAKGMFKEKKE